MAAHTVLRWRPYVDLSIWGDSGLARPHKHDYLETHRGPARPYVGAGPAVEETRSVVWVAVEAHCLLQDTPCCAPGLVAVAGCQGARCRIARRNDACFHPDWVVPGEEIAFTVVEAERLECHCRIDVLGIHGRHGTDEPVEDHSC